MSTSEVFLSPEEIQEFIRESRIAPQYFYGFEGRELGVCPYVTFYVFHDKAGAPAVVDAAIKIYEEFSRLIDEPWQLIWRDRDQSWRDPDDPLLPSDLHEEARIAHGKSEVFIVGRNC